MISKDTLIKVTNKYNGTVGYDIPDDGVHRNFFPNESKDIAFGELEKLFYTPGGTVILKDYLEIKNDDAFAALFYQKMEPEYHYSKEDIKELMEKGNLDQFLDCLDFAPEAVKEQIKQMAVELPLNDVSKRKAILDKLGFDVSRAIEIKNTKYDGGDENKNSSNQARKTGRRAAPLNTKKPVPSGRRYQPSVEK